MVESLAAELGALASVSFSSRNRMVKSSIYRLLLVCAAVSCSPTWSEVGRAHSPDGQTDAVLEEGDGGATIPFYYRVRLVPSAGTGNDAVVANLESALREDTTAGAELRWPSPDTLFIEYLFAKEAEVVDSAPQFNGKRLHVVLKPDPTCCFVK